MDKKFIWTTAMNSEEGFAVAALDVLGSTQLHSEKETVNKIIEILNNKMESNKMDFDAFNAALKVNKLLPLPNSITFVCEMKYISDSMERRTLKAIYKKEENDNQKITFYENRSVEDIEKLIHKCKKDNLTIDNLISILKTKGIDEDLWQWLPVYTKFFPIQVLYNPLVKEQPISKDSPKKTPIEGIWTVTDTTDNRVLVQTDSKCRVMEILQLETNENIKYYTSMYKNIMQYYYKSRTIHSSDYVEVWIDFEKIDDVILYRTLKEVFKNVEVLNSRSTKFGTEIKFKFSSIKSSEAISAIAKKYFSSMIAFQNIRSEFFNGHEINPEDFPRFIKAFADEGYKITIK